MCSIKLPPAPLSRRHLGPQWGEYGADASITRASLTHA